MAQKATVGEARFSLMIYGPSLDMDALDTALSLHHTRCTRTGDVLNHLPRLEATEDMWCCEVPLTTPNGEDAELNALLTTIAAHKKELAELAQTGRVMMRMYVQSDRAQMAYQLMPETLQRLSDTGLPLDVTSLSWGEIGL